MKGASCTILSSNNPRRLGHLYGSLGKLLFRCSNRSVSHSPREDARPLQWCPPSSKLHWGALNVNLVISSTKRINSIIRRVFADHWIRPSQSVAVRHVICSNNWFSELLEARLFAVLNPLLRRPQAFLNGSNGLDHFGEFLKFQGADWFNESRRPFDS